MALTVNRLTAPPPPTRSAPLSFFSPSPTASSSLAQAVGGMFAPAPPQPPVRTLLTAPAPSPAFPASLPKYLPATTGATTTIPVPSQSPPSATIDGMFAKLGLFGAPAPAPLALRSPLRPISVSGVNAPAVGTRPATLLQSVRAATSWIAPFNPPFSPPAVGPVRADAYLPPSAPPVTPAASTSSGAASTALPSGGGGYSTEGAPMPWLEQEAQPAPAPAGPSFGTIALYGAAGLGGLFLLSKMFGGSRSSSA